MSIIWYPEIESAWPEPLAQEYRALRTIHQQGEADGNPWAALAALLQLRDFAEITTKLLATTLAVAIDQESDATPAQQDAQEAFLTVALNQPSLGSWAGAFRRTLKAYPKQDHVLDASPLAPLLGLGDGFIKWLDPFVSTRNAEIGHGALRSDMDVLKESVESNVKGLHRALNGHTDAWRGFRLEVDANEAPAKNDAPAAPQNVRLRHDSGWEVTLNPFLAGRRCAECGRTDLFVANGRKGKKLTCLDYHRGHHTSALAEHDPALTRHLARAPETQPGVTAAAAHDTVKTRDITALNAASVENEVLPPEYLYDDLREFMAGQDRGTFWLQAPAHTGKTVFAQGLGPALDQLPQRSLVCTLHIRRFYDFTESAFNHFLRQTVLAEGLGIDVRNLPRSEDIPWQAGDTGPLPQLCADYLKKIAEHWMPPEGYARLVLCLDGLDELPVPHPGDRSILNFLPTPDQLPENVYLVLTSRPETDTDQKIYRRVQQLCPDDVPEANRTHSSAQNPAYRTLVHRYFKEVTRDRGLCLGDEQSDTFFTVIANKSDWVFLYAAHLSRIVAEGFISEPEQIQTLPSGPSLFTQHLRQLTERFGAKEAHRVEQLILLLAAAEEAHAELVRIVPPGYVENPWHGLSLQLIAELLDYPSVHLDANQTPRVPLRLAYTLAVARETIRTWRADQQATQHLQIGLKGFVEELRLNSEWAAKIDGYHRRLHGLAELLTGTGDAAAWFDDPLTRHLLLRGVPHALAAGANVQKTEWIRKYDSCSTFLSQSGQSRAFVQAMSLTRECLTPVSYTHLTLPTICSV